MFFGDWIQPIEFAGLKPIDVFHADASASVHPAELQNLHVHFFADVTLVRRPSSAVLRVSADDYYKLSINGRFVCQGPAPGYHFRYSWNETDISSYLEPGVNRLEFEVYYQGLINRVWCSGDLRCGMACDLTVDGKLLLKSGEGFAYYISRRWGKARVFGYDTQFAEEYDASMPEPAPRPVYVNKADDHVFSDEPAELLEVYEIEPKTIENLPNGGIFCDFGEEITGTLNVFCDGGPGSVVDIFSGEETDGSSKKVLCPTRAGCDYHDIFILGEEKVFRGYDYKAFRYASAVPKDGAKILRITATVRHAKFRERFPLKTGNAVLDSVLDLCRRAVKLGAQEVFVDCPGREKGQYSGDLLVTAEAYYLLTGETKTLRRAIQSLMDSAFINKGLPAVAPCSHMQEIADYSLQFPLLARRYYDFTGDMDFLRRCLDTCEGVLDYFSDYADESGLLVNAPKWNLVDWPENLRDGYEFAECHNVINAWYISAVTETERIRGILTLPPKRGPEPLKDAFNRAFLCPKTGLYVDNPDSSHSSLHANVMPLFAGIVPAENVERVADCIEEKGLCCGVCFAYFLLKALIAAGRRDAALRLITSTGENSWYNMVREGGTSCFEAWGKDKKWNTSLCHPWASAPLIIAYELYSSEK